MSIKKPIYQIDAIQHLRDEALRARMQWQTLDMAAQHLQVLMQTAAALEEERDVYKQENEQLKAAQAAEK